MDRRSGFFENISKRMGITSQTISSNKKGKSFFELVKKVKEKGDQSFEQHITRIISEPKEGLIDLSNFVDPVIKARHMPRLIELLGKNDDISTVDLSSANLDDESFNALLTNLPHLNGLKYRKGLYTSNIKLETLRRFTEHKLTCLDLSSHTLDEEGFKILAQNLSLEALYVDNCSVSDLMLTHFANHPSLRILDLRSNNIGPGGVKTVLTLLQLKELNLANNELNDESGVMLASTKLKKLNLWGNNLTSKTTKAFAEKNTTLEILNFGNNGIDDARIRKKGAGDQAAIDLSKLSHLKEVNLWGNNISSIDAIIALATSQLTHINLRYNNIDNEGARMFLNNPRLVSVELGNNVNISTDVMLKILSQMRENQKKSDEDSASFRKNFSFVRKSRASK